MKIAYWGEMRSGVLFLKSARAEDHLFAIFRHKDGNFSIYSGCEFRHMLRVIMFRYLEDAKLRCEQFDTLKEAVLECERGARSAGYRILTEAELNLL